MGYSLIMANQVMEYYSDTHEFIQFVQRQLAAEGIFITSRGKDHDLLVAPFLVT